MGWDWDATAVIGVEIPATKLRETARERCCAHPETAGKFCPECGRPTWEEGSRWRDCVREEAGGEYRVAGYAMVRGLGDRFVYVGLATDRAGGQKTARMLRPGAVETLGAVAGDLQQKLEPLGLWDEARFGLWVVMNGG